MIGTFHDRSPGRCLLVQRSRRGDRERNMSPSDATGGPVSDSGVSIIGKAAGVLRREGIAAFLRQLGDRTLDHFHERRLGIDTRGYIRPEVLGFAYPEHHAYDPIDERAWRLWGSALLVRALRLGFVWTLARQSRWLGGSPQVGSESSRACAPARAGCRSPLTTRVRLG